MYPLREYDCRLLPQALEDGATSPSEELLSDDEFDAPGPARAESFVSEKPVAHIAAR